MRCLSEPFARRAKRENACTGRFWEGRNRRQALLDDVSVMTCMTYVDLNPTRAGITPDLAPSEHTSVRDRMERLHAIESIDNDAALTSVAGIATEGLSLGLRDHLALVEFTGRAARPDKRGTLASDATPIIRRLGIDDTQWQGQVFGSETHYWPAVGAVDVLLSRAEAIGQCWLKGSRTHRRATRAD